MRIVLTGGGTGGHIIPFAAIIEALRMLHMEKKASLPSYLEPDELQLYFTGVVTDEAKVLFESYDVPSKHIPAGKLRRYISSLTVIDLFFRLPLGTCKALAVMWHIMPDAVISKGGYGSLPTVFAAWVYRIPVLLHESDSVLGAANMLMARLSTGIALGYSAAQPGLGKYVKKSAVTGNPVRSALRHMPPAQGKRTFNIPDNEFVLLVFGGSQGAQQLNEALLEILPKLITDTAILHVAGPTHIDAIRTVARDVLAHSPRKHLYMPFGYLGDTMLAAISAADAVVTRAGTSLAELAAAKKPALIIPLDGAAGDHQRKNAQVFESAGASLVLDPANVRRNLFEQNIRRLRTDGALRQQLSENISRLDFPNAARDIASLAFYIAQGYQPQQNS